MSFLWLHNDIEGKQVVVVVSGKAQYETRAAKQAFPCGEFGIIIQSRIRTTLQKEISVLEVGNATCGDVSFYLLRLTRFVMWLLMGWSTCASMLLPPLPRTQRLPSPLTMSTTSGESLTSPRSSPLPSWTGHLPPALSSHSTYCSVFYWIAFPGYSVQFCWHILQ